MRKKTSTENATPGGAHSLESLAAAAELFTVPEAARALKCSQRAVRQLLDQNRLDVRPAGTGKASGITGASLAAYLSAQAALHTPAPPQTTLAVHDTGTQVLLGAVAVSELQCRPLIQVLNEVEDFRFERGRRYRLATLLAFACAAMLCGCQTYSEIVQWGQDHRTLITSCLGVHRPPSIRTIRLVFRGLDPRDLNARLQLWCSGLVEVMAPQVGVEWPREPFYKNRRSLLANLRKRSRVVGSDSLVALGRRVGLHRVREHSSTTEKAEEVIGPVLEALMFQGRVMYVSTQVAGEESGITPAG